MVERYLIVVLCLVVCFGLSDGLKCYECYPDKNDDCSETFGEEKDCKNGTYCRKMRQTVLSKVTYVRQCGRTIDGKFRESYATANDYVKANVYQCKQDLCNSALPLLNILVFVAILLVGWAIHF